MPRQPAARIIRSHGFGAFRSLEEIRREAAMNGRFLPLRQRAFVDSAEWAALPDEARLRTRIEIVATAAFTHEPVFAYSAAGSLHALPLYRVDARFVHVIASGANPAKSRFDVVRHHEPLPSLDVVRLDGRLATSLARTVYDLIRVADIETAVAVFDAALRQVAWSDSTLTYDDAAAERFRQAVLDRVDAAPRARGRRQARFVTRFAEGRAQLPGESVSRLWMHQLGVATPILQKRVAAASRRVFFLDMAWPELGRWGEFDGEGKYRLAQFTGGRSEAVVRRAEIEREFEIRRATGWSPVRWGRAQMASLETFSAFLHEEGLLP